MHNADTPPPTTMTDDRYRHLEGEVTGAKTEIAGIKTDVAAVKTDVGILGQNFHSLKDEMVMGFRIGREDTQAYQKDLKASITEDKNQPTSIKLSLLFAGIGVVFPTLALAASVILLLFNPLRDRQRDSDAAQHSHEEAPSHAGAAASLALLQERAEGVKRGVESEIAHLGTASVARHEAQEIQIDLLESKVLMLQEQRVKDAETRGRLQAYDMWLRDDVEALKVDLHRHAEQTDHPTPNNREK